MPVPEGVRWAYWIQWLCTFLAIFANLLFLRIPHSTEERIVIFGYSGVYLLYTLFSLGPFFRYRRGEALIDWQNLLSCIFLSDVLLLVRHPAFPPLHQSLIVFSLGIALFYGNPRQGLVASLLVWAQYGGLSVLFRFWDSILMLFLLPSLLIPICYSLRQRHVEVERQTRLYAQARWAASQLSTLTTQINGRIQRERVDSIMKERKIQAAFIHDTMGHMLTAQIVQLERLLLDDQLSRDRLQTLLDISRKTLKEIREKVEELRNIEIQNDVENYAQLIERACEDFAECTGVRIVCVLNILPKQMDVLGQFFYQIIKEGLTNAYRHGKSSYIAVRGRYDEKLNMILLKISDDGAGALTVDPGSGLSGIQERVENLGGTVFWQTLPNRGFDLGVDVPWRDD